MCHATHPCRLAVYLPAGSLSYTPVPRYGLKRADRPAECDNRHRHQGCDRQWGNDPLLSEDGAAADPATALSKLVSARGAHHGNVCCPLIAALLRG